MDDLRIIYCSSFSRQEQRAQTFTTGFLNLNVCGLNYLSSYFPDGKLSFELKGDTAAKPFLSLGVARMRSRFCYSSRRENHYLAFTAPGISFVKKEKTLAISHCGKSIPVSAYHALSQENMLDCKIKFMEIQHCLSSPSPKNLLRARCIFTGLLDYFLRDVRQPLVLTVARKLRELIDSDLEFARNLSELCAECGVCRDHGRRVFISEFKITPSEYRRQKRMAQLHKLLTSSDKSIAEIAQMLSFKHVSHLSMFVKKQTNMTPLDIIRQHRGS